MASLTNLAWSCCGQVLDPMKNPPPCTKTNTGNFWWAGTFVGTVMFKHRPSISDDSNTGFGKACWMKENSMSMPCGIDMTEGLWFIVRTSAAPYNKDEGLRYPCCVALITSSWPSFPQSTGLASRFRREAYFRPRNWMTLLSAEGLPRIVPRSGWLRSSVIVTSHLWAVVATAGCYVPGTVGSRSILLVCVMKGELG